MSESFCRELALVGRQSCVNGVSVDTAVRLTGHLETLGMASDDGLLVVVRYSDEAYGGLVDMAVGAENRHKGQHTWSYFVWAGDLAPPFLAACGLRGVRGLPGNRGLRGLLHLPSAAAP